MTLLRFYFMVGGEQFDAEGFSDSALRHGFEFGKRRTIKNIKRLHRADSSKIVDRAIYSGIRGTSGAQFSTWETAIVNFAIDRDIYLANRDLRMSTEAAQLWLVEENALVVFLKLIKEKLPFVGDFCSSEFFLLLKLVYGYDEEQDRGGGHHYSETLIRLLNDLNAGLSIDKEPFDLHFERLQK